MADKNKDNNENSCDDTAKISSSTDDMPSPEAKDTEADEKGDSEADDVKSSVREEKEYKIIAAIDFGTTFSGYAYSFADDTEKIYTNKNWGQTQGFLLHKTPTCLLLRADGSFEAFGFEAVSKYNDLGEDEADSYYYFDRFKMRLYDNKVSVTVLPAKSDSDVMFCLQSYQGLIIDRSLVY